MSSPIKSAILSSHMKITSASFIFNSMIFIYVHRQWNSRNTFFGLQLCRLLVILYLHFKWENTRHYIWKISLFFFSIGRNFIENSKHWHWFILLWYNKTAVTIMKQSKRDTHSWSFSVSLFLVCNVSCNQIMIVIVLLTEEWELSSDFEYFRSYDFFKK